MVTANDEEQETDLIRCKLCEEHVWIRKDRMEKHIAKVHAPNAPARKGFTTYHANLVSSFPPKVISPASPSISKPGTIKLTSRTSQRTGQGRCTECGTTALILWHYPESNQGPVDLCSQCKPVVFERSFGKNEMGKA